MGHFPVNLVSLERTEQSDGQRVIVARAYVDKLSRWESKIFPADEVAASAKWALDRFTQVEM